jgi:hypothetical protein
VNGEINGYIPIGRIAVRKNDLSDYTYTPSGIWFSKSPSGDGLLYSVIPNDLPKGEISEMR